MKIKHNGKWLLILFIAILTLVAAGCAPEQPAETDEPEIPAADPPVEDPAVDDPEEDPLNGEDPDRELSGEMVDGVREIEIEASSFEFDPDEIVVEEGDDVRLIVTSADIAHVLEIDADEYDVSIRVEPGETEEVEFTADAAGEYDYICPIPGHEDMIGKLIVL